MTNAEYLKILHTLSTDIINTSFSPDLTDEQKDANQLVFDDIMNYCEYLRRKNDKTNISAVLKNLKSLGNSGKNNIKFYSYELNREINMLRSAFSSAAEKKQLCKQLGL